jgi:hypothetical protein
MKDPHWQHKMFQYPTCYLFQETTIHNRNSGYRENVPKFSMSLSVQNFGFTMFAAMFAVVNELNS